MSRYLRVIPKELTERQVELLAFLNTIYHCTRTAEFVCVAEVVADANAYHETWKDDPYSPTEGVYTAWQAEAALELLASYGLLGKK